MLALTRSSRGASMATLGALLVGAGVCLGGPASAQEQGVMHLETWEPLPIGASTLGVPATKLLPAFTASAELAMSYADKVLEVLVIQADSDAEPTRATVFPGRLRLEAFFAYGLIDGLQVGVGVPFYDTTGTPEAGYAGRTAEELDGTAFGDVRMTFDLDFGGLLGPRIRSLLHGVGIGFGVTTWFPTGNTTKFTGEGTFRFEPRVALDWEAPRGWKVGTFGGYHFRQASTVEGYINDDVWRWGLQVAVPIGQTGLDVVSGAYGTNQTTLQPDPRDPSQKIDIPSYNPRSFITGARYHTPFGLKLDGAAGGGISSGVGTPAFRLIAQAAYEVDIRDWLPEVLDADNDGIEDDEDRCPYEPENLDDIRDDDGCPEDHEMIAIVKAEQEEAAREAAEAAAAAAEAERKKAELAALIKPIEVEEEEVQDLEESIAPPAEVAVIEEEKEEELVITSSWDPNALPALSTLKDSDGDEIADRWDRCPDQPEDMDGYLDDDGCPEDDNDGDGLLDDEDKCPLEAETPNRFQDEDGCADQDSDEDGDGVGDTMDLCPYEPEPMDGVRDADGCPEAPEEWKDEVPWKDESPEPEPVEEAPEVEEPEDDVPQPFTEELATFDATAVLPPLPIDDDKDGDGLGLAEDICPDEAEDFDGFEDGDGCLDPDDDMDGVPDINDACGTLAETINGVLDGDGCPDREGDMDGDDIGDVEDMCPFEREDKDNIRDTDGCPELDHAILPPPPVLEEEPALAEVAEAPAEVSEIVEEAVDLQTIVDEAQISLPSSDDTRADASELEDLPPVPLDLFERKDRDRDGLFDDEDVCPDHKEDKDGIQDWDGCPEDDYDHDGVPDRRDRCPEEAETHNGFQDKDGCPELGPDADGDKISDAIDLCPYEPETDDQRRDVDGCPEAPREWFEDDPFADGAEVPAAKPAPPTPRPAKDEKSVADEPGLSEPVVPKAFSAPLEPNLRPLGDVDQDGIADGVDACPTAKEDRDGFQDDDGCPEADNDNDGLIDSMDACPLESENINGILDEDGCPDRGNDEDGDLIDDEDDLCPCEPEDMDGVRDSDGCPEIGWTSRPTAVPETPTLPIYDDPAAATVRATIAMAPLVLSDNGDKPEVLLPSLLPNFDADGDGIDTDEDACPFQVEDMDGFQDGDGCPDPDDDLDGIVDALDLCPREGESWNNFSDEDGCPDITPEEVAAVVKKAHLILFKPGSSVLDPSSKAVLLEVLETLKGDKQLLLEVEGHTDTVGEAEFNLALSGYRAQAVVGWLTSRGIDKSRLTSEGFGDTRPKATNDTDEGRRENRRVELVYDRRSETP